MYFLSLTDILSPDPPVSPGSSDLHSAPLTAMHGSSQDVIRGTYVYHAIDMNHTKHKTALDNSNSLQSALNLYSESLIPSHHSKTLDIMTKTKPGILYAM